MNDAEQVPLDVYLAFRPQSKTVQFHDMTDMGERRFTNGQSHTINYSTDCGVDLPLHFLGEPFHALRVPAHEIGGLARLGAIRMPQALRPEFARYAGRLGATELHRCKAMDVTIAARPVQSFPGRAETMGQVIGKGKIGCF